MGNNDDKKGPSLCTVPLTPTLSSMHFWQRQWTTVQYSLPSAVPILLSLFSAAASLASVADSWNPKQKPIHHCLSLWRNTGSTTTSILYFHSAILSGACLQKVTRVQVIRRVCSTQWEHSPSKPPWLFLWSQILWKLHKSFRWDCKHRSPVCICMQKNQKHMWKICSLCHC